MRVNQFILGKCTDSSVVLIYSPRALKVLFGHVILKQEPQNSPGIQKVKKAVRKQSVPLFDRFSFHLHQYQVSSLIMAKVKLQSELAVKWC